MPTPRLPPIDWTIGLELELLAPPGRTRRDLADAIAAAQGGRVRPYFLPQEEPSQVPGMKLFNNLTLAFEVEDGAGGWWARCVDDLTLQDDLDRQAPPQPGWFRIVSDDRRLLSLVARHGVADQGLRGALAPTAALFGTPLEESDGGMLRVRDAQGSTVAIGAPLPGERERPCELITPPIAQDHAARLDALLQHVHALGFTLPAEAATHIHFDRTPLQSARAITNLVNLYETWGPTLRAWLHTNPRCRRLGPLDPALVERVNQRDWAMLPWTLAQEALRALNPSTYRDLNLRNIAHDIEGKPTIEVRILPGLRDATPILAATGLFAGLLRLAARGRPVPRREPLPPSSDAAHQLLDQIGLPRDILEVWPSPV